MGFTTQRRVTMGLGCLMAALPTWSQNSMAPAQLSNLPIPSSESMLPKEAPALQITRDLFSPQPGDLRILTTNIAVAGVHSIAFEEIAAIFQPLSGTEVLLSQLNEAAAQATLRYQQAGYPLSFVYVPAQTFENGLVQVIAVEGYTSDIAIIGDAGKSTHLVQAMAQPLLEEKPLQQSTFERQTLLMSRMENLKVTAHAALPTNVEGATPLQLKIDRQPISVNLGADLAQSNSKAVGTVTLNDPLWWGSQWQLTSILDKPSKERFVSATLRQWVNPQGTQMRLAYSDFKGNDNYVNFSLDDVTRQQRLELNVSHPLHLSNQKSSIVGASIFANNYTKSYLFAELGLGIEDEEKVRALQLQWNGHLSRGQTQHYGNVALTQGLDALGAGLARSNTLNLPMQANAARLDFTRLSADYKGQHRFANQWGIGFGIGGQYAGHTLPVSERVTFGSARYGKGYRSGEAAGDRGLGTSLEVNRAFARSNGKWVTVLEPYLMYEYAKTWFEASGVQGQVLRSTSAGIRFGDGRFYNLDLFVAKPQGDPSPYNPEKKVRFGLTLQYRLDM